jgi:hypothetical protein
MPIRFIKVEDMQASDREALHHQQVAQHPAARKRVLQMQLVHPPHDGQIRC